MVRARTWLLLVLGCLIGVASLEAQLRVTSNLPSRDYIDSDFGVELSVSGTLTEGERIAVMIGDEDVSALLAAVTGGFSYQSNLLGLPVGQNDMVVYQVTAEGDWNQIASFPMKVRSGLGVEEINFKPKVDLTFSAQPANGEDPEPVNPREVPEVLDGKFQMVAELIHRDFTFSGTALLVGTSERDRRLRFRELEDDAPLIDLSSYRLDHEQSKVKLSLGHVRAGNQRHLINGFGSRGATMTVSASSRVDFNLAANAGRQEVGWGDLLGVGDGDHRVMSASMGVEAFERPGALRVEVGWMDGSILPRSSFNQGNINDAETSNGLSVRVQASGLDRRLRLDAGWAQSTFDNPLDAELNQGQNVVDVQERTNDARYLDANLDVIRGLKLGGNKTAKLSVGYKHERVDPLYRTVAASVRSDNLQNQLDVRADVAGITIQSNFSSSEDNLDDIASILKSNTDRRSVNVGIPLPRIFRGKSWLPSLQYRNDRTHQFGEELPTNGGFSEGHVPDQMSVNQSLSVDWRGSKVSFRYRLNHSDQDNRQAGRETADFKTLTSGFGLGINPMRALQLSFDLNLDRSDNLGADERDNTRKYGVNATWRPIDRSTLSFRFSDTFKDDDAGTREQTGRTMDLKWSSRIPKAKRFNGTYFVRYNRSESGRIDRVRDVTQDRSRWTVNVGASIGFAKR